MDGGPLRRGGLSGAEGELTVSLARAVVLACGGAGQVFAHTTNPAVATGDGHAMAYRAGARAARHGVHAVPSHGLLRRARTPPCCSPRPCGVRAPTCSTTRASGSWWGRIRGPSWLRGTWWCGTCKRVFDRDKTDHVWLDARHLECGFLRERFPTVYTGLQEAGLRSVHPAHPGGAGLSLLHRGGAHRHLGPDHHPGALRLRRDGQHRHPRRQPAGLQLPA